MKNFTTSAVFVLLFFSAVINSSWAQKADFSYTKPSGCSPLVVQFTNKSTAATSYVWRFGNGNQSTQTNPTAVYYKPGKYSISLYAYGKGGAVDSLIQTQLIEVFSNPEVGFAANSTGGCMPFTAKFADTTKLGSGKITNWLWDFGDGTTSTLQNPSHTYSYGGTYTVQLQVLDVNGCKHFAKTYNMINVTKAPEADFTLSYKGACASPTVVDFTNKTAGNTTGYTYVWNFGDGTTSTSTSPSHSYTSDGHYTVSLTAQAPSGCKSTVTKKRCVVVGKDKAGFSVASNSGCLPFAVKFTKSTPTDSLSSYTWDFGDGSKNGHSRDTNYLYTKTGTFNVKLVVTAANGCKDSFTYKNCITVIGSPVAKFSYSDTGNCSAPYKVTFTDQSVGATSWAWDFGDGTTSTEKNPTHVYKSISGFVISLTVSNAANCSSNYKLAYKACAPITSFKIVESSQGCTPYSIRIVDETVTKTKIASRTIDMGDGNKFDLGTKDTFYYTYKAPPKVQKYGYTITFTVVDVNGSTSSYKFKVKPLKPIPDFTYRYAAVCGQTEYQFTPIENDNTSFGPCTYIWKFDNGAKVITPGNAPVVYFPKDGTYNVSMVVIDHGGCRDSITKTITTTTRSMKVDFLAVPVFSNCPPLLVKFYDKSTCVNTHVSSWRWSFGDGSYSSLQSPGHVYQLPGKYTVCLITTDSMGCSDSVSKVQHIEVRGPRGSYSFDKKEGCSPLNVSFTAISKNASNYLWDFGDGTISNGLNAKHTYKYQAGMNKFIPMLILSDSNGCMVTLPPVDTITVYSPPTATINSTIGCKGHPSYFSATVDSSSSIQNRLWDFGDGTTSTDNDPIHTYTTSGTFNVNLSVVPHHGCAATASTTVTIGELKADFTSEVAVLCLGNPVKFYDKSATDGQITKRTWMFGDGTTSNEVNPEHRYAQGGNYDVALIIENDKGCTDSIIKKQYMSIGDNNMPSSPKIYRTSVVDNSTTLLSFAKYNGGGFKRYIIYRENGGKYDSIGCVYHREDTLFNDKNLNCPAQSYSYKVGVENICGVISSIITSTEHTTIELSVTPLANKNVLKWNAYEGWKAVSTYNVFREDRRHEGKFDFLGYTPGNVTTYLDNAVGCSGRYVYKIVANEGGGNGMISISDTAGAEPVHEEKVEATKITTVTVDQNKDIKVTWAKSEEPRIRKYVLERSQDGQRFSIIGILDPTVTELVDEEVKVNEQNYIYRVWTQDSCYNVSDYSNTGKNIILHTSMSNDGATPSLVWNKYEQWAEGVKYYEIQIKNEDGSFSFVAHTKSGKDTTFTDNITSQNGRSSYTYRVIARCGANSNDEKFSTSNESAAKIKPVIFVPNAFSPNGDGDNDLFEAKATFCKDFSIKIFNRIGQMVFESNDINKSWDGTFRGIQCNPDVYTYTIKAVGTDKQPIFLNGNITLIQ